MPQIQTFSTPHIPAALALWRATEHVGLNAQDDNPQRIARFLLRNEGCSFVALDHGQLAGACLCGHDGRRGAIYHLAVGPPFRRGHLGRELVQACLAALAQQGVHKCQAFVFKDNPYNARFWVPEGWILRSDLLMYSKMSA